MSAVVDRAQRADGITTGRRHLAAVVLLASAVFGLYVFLVPLGLPYDEPSHWGYVRFLAEHGTLPVLGDRSVGYEAQMGPVAYIPQAFALLFWQQVGGADSLAPYVVRACGLPALVIFYLLVRRVVQAVLPQATPGTVTAGAAVAVLNPMVVAMSASIQNDVVSLTLLTWLLVMVLEQPVPATRERAVLHGLLGGVVLLSKISLGPAVAVLLIWPVLVRRREAVPRALVSASVGCLTSGWWFLRNELLYGDLTGRAGMANLGLEFPPLGVSVASIAHLASSVVVYLALPVEYYRNTISAPVAVDLVVGLLLVAAGALGLAGLRRAWSAGWALVWSIGGVSVVAWGLTALLLQAVAFRTAYATLPLWAAIATGALTRRSSLLASVFALTSVGLHAWVLVSVGTESFPAGLQM